MSTHACAALHPSSQNAGNVMTGRSTTRIHAPPGGGSSISFGGDAPAPKQRSGVKRIDPNASRKQKVSANAYASGSNQASIGNLSGTLFCSHNLKCSLRDVHVCTFVTCAERGQRDDRPLDHAHPRPAGRRQQHQLWRRCAPKASSDGKGGSCGLSRGGAHQHKRCVIECGESRLVSHREKQGACARLFHVRH